MTDDVISDDVAVIRTRFPRMGHRQAILFRLLWLSRNRVVTNTRLLAALDREVGSYVTSTCPLRYHAKALRDVFRKEAVPLSLRCMALTGYILHVLEPGWTWEDDELHLSER